MITLEYKNMYAAFINHYKEKCVNPWHEISEEELNKIYDGIVTTQNIDNDYSFNYLMHLVIKKLSGKSDAHTMYDDTDCIPMNFKIFNDEVLVNFPEHLKGSKLVAINGIDINVILKEIDNVITYGTEGKKVFETEKALFNKKLLFGLPLLRNVDILSMKFIDLEGNEFEKTFVKNEKYSSDQMWDRLKYLHGNPGTYEIKDNKLIISHTSVQNRYKEAIEGMVEELRKLDLESIDTIVVDIRGNTGGNSANSKSLMDFLKDSGKRIMCLTDYRVFSGGRYALIDLIKLGATTIGTEISTPLNCFGNSDWIEYNKHYFSSSSWYLAPNIGWSASSQEEYASEVTEEILKPAYFKPDIEIEQTKEDYINGIDTVLSYTLEMLNSKKL